MSAGPPGVVHAARALVGGEIVDHVAIEVDAVGRITVLRPATSSDPRALDGLVVPGLVNAHLHLELSWAAGAIEGGEGLVPWVVALRATPVPADARGKATHAAHQLAEGGTALACDVSNLGDTASILHDADLAGIVEHERLGMDPAVHAALLAQVCDAGVQRQGAVVTRPSPHATYSTPGPLVQAASRPLDGVVAAIHVAEDPGEAEFLRQGTGPFAALLDQLGIDRSWFVPPGRSPVGWLHDLGVLGPDLMLVHGVHLSGADRALIAASGASLCLCPRSNLHIGGVLPDVPALLNAGIPLALGTDSLASSPDLDVLGEVAVLVDAFPHVDALTWLRIATAGGARALRRPGYGAIGVGLAPGLVLLEGVGAPEALANVPSRRWLVRPAHA